MVLTIGPGHARSQERLADEAEYKFKAVYLYHFLHFIEWPDSGRDSAVVIGILGTDPFGEDLEKLTRNEFINNKPIVIKHLSNTENVNQCMILFIARTSSYRSRDLLRHIPAGVVTVGETKGFAENGGAINFYVSEGKLRFEINRESLDRAGVKASPQLLRLATLVDTNAKKGSPR